MTYDARNANGLPRGASVENCADGAAEYAIRGRFAT
jgi:hypothetical protein